MDDSLWPAYDVERVAIFELVPYARNPRLHSPEQVERIAASIREFGWTMPVLRDEYGGLIAGHGRVLAAESLGITHVPAITARGWSEAQRRAYVIADNKLTLNGNWDNDLLRVELGELSEIGFDLNLTGFLDSELKTLLGGDSDEPEAPEAFGEYGETIPTEHQCPKCGYRWSGKAN